MPILLAIFLFFVALAVAVGAFILGANIVMWNVSDIAANGANFWNCFWLLLVLVVFSGGAARASR